MNLNSDVETTGAEQPADGSPQLENQEPRSESEKYLASLLVDIVGLDEVKLSDKFLDIGGNSLTLNIILNRVETEKGVSLPAVSFFDPDTSSLSDLAREMDTLLENKANGAPAASCAQ